ncbi:MAG: Sec-independent protein translocase protein TatB [Burkholderiaceae bacterium]|jgi:sec-independent protein translocase protein TatB
MFDIGFTEMMVVAAVALIVIGPERLPKVARQAGQWITKLRRYVDDVKSDFNRQVELSELKNLRSQVEDAARSIEGEVKDSMSDAQQAFDSVRSDFESSGPAEPQAVTDWDKIYAVRRTRDRIRDRRVERERALGLKRPKRPLHR